MTETIEAQGQRVLEAIHQVMKEVGYVQKKGRNDFHKYNYAGEADLLAVLRPAMLEAGLILLPSLVDQVWTDEHGNTHIVMEYTLAHVSGDVWPETLRIPGSGNDMSSKGRLGDKGPYKALTGANKYLLFKLFQIETGDDPENADGTGADTDAPPAGRREGADEREKPGCITEGGMVVLRQAAKRRLDELGIKNKSPEDFRDHMIKQRGHDDPWDLPLKDVSLVQADIKAWTKSK